MAAKKETGILVGAAPLGAESLFLMKLLNKKNCISVAADGGLSFFVKNYIAPDFWIGDQDSLDATVFKNAKKLFPGLKLNPCEREKDDTDMRLSMLALKDAGVREIYVFGGLGGNRFDHSIANIQLLHEFAEYKIQSFLISENEYLYVLKAKEKVTYKTEAEGILSVFSLTDETKLAIRELYYEFDGTIDNKRVFTVSNEFNKKGGTVEVFEGAALIVRPVRFTKDLNLFEIQSVR